jgi:membrane-associated HD superfamily phosphohydrolase
MIHYLLKSISYIFHPLIMPLLGIILYFSKTPRSIPDPVIKAKVFSITILTIILPILLYFLLKTIKKVDSLHLKSTKERIIPLIINTLIIILILNRVLPYYEIPELYYFYLGILFSTLTCLFLALFKIKASIHMIASAGFFMFAIALSIHFKININGTIALMCIIIGAIATSRLHLKAHTNIELLIGFFVGFLPQLVLLNYWL